MTFKHNIIIIFTILLMVGLMIVLIDYVDPMQEFKDMYLENDCELYSNYNNKITWDVATDNVWIEQNGTKYKIDTPYSTLKTECSKYI